MAFPPFLKPLSPGNRSKVWTPMVLGAFLITTLWLPAEGRTETYTIDPEHTLPVFEVSHLGFSTQRGRFDRTSGQIQLDLLQKKGSVDFIIDADSISMGSEKWNTHLKAEDWFDVAHHPKIQFTSTQLLFKDSVPIEALGELTLRGITRPLKVNILHFHCGVQPILKKPLCAADIEAHLKRSEFGMMLYLPGVGDDIQIHVPTEAYRD